MTNRRANLTDSAVLKVDRTTEFARKVVAGEPIDGRKYFGLNEIMCCQRHLNDMKRQGTKEFPYIFNEERAQLRIDFAECLTIAEGKKKTPLKLYEFQAFIRGSEYGWIHKDTGFRRFRSSFKFMGKKNGKSFDNSENAVYYSNFDNYMYPQIVCAAVVEKQAKIVLKSAIRFIETDKDLKEEFIIQEYNSLIKAKRTYGEVIAVGRDSESLEGIEPYYMSVDEYHLHPNNQIYEIGVGGQVELDECLLSAISTAGFRLNGPCKEHYDYCVNIISGTFVNETQFVYIATPNKDADIFAESTWQMANPLWSEKKKNNIQTLADKAKAKGGADFKNFITKTCNLWYASSDNDYLDKEKWRNCSTDRTIEDMNDRECVLGLDLSSGGDLTSGNLEFVLKENERIKYFIDGHSFMPVNRLAEHIKADDAPYDVWVNEGLITTTATLGGYKTDYKYIITYYKELIKTHNLKLLAIGYDPHNASAFLSDLEEFGVPCIEIVQSCKSLNEATDDFSNTVDALDVEYDRKNVLLYHSFNNARTVKNSFGEIKIDKEHATERIDPCSAAICSHKVIMTMTDGYDPDNYASDELLDKLWG